MSDETPEETPPPPPPTPHDPVAQDESDEQEQEPQEERLCQRCNAVIPAERVAALPDTEVCIACSTAIGGEFKLAVIPDSIGKSTSMKKNYGVFSLQKTRKRIWPVKPKQPKPDA